MELWYFGIIIVATNTIPKSKYLERPIEETKTCGNEKIRDSEPLLNVKNERKNKNKE